MDDRVLGNLLLILGLNFHGSLHGQKNRGKGASSSLVQVWAIRSLMTEEGKVVSGVPSIRFPIQESAAHPNSLLPMALAMERASGESSSSPSMRVQPIPMPCCPWREPWKDMAWEGVRELLIPGLPFVPQGQTRAPSLSFVKVDRAPWSGPKSRGSGHEQQGLGVPSSLLWMYLSMAHAMGSRTGEGAKLLLLGSSVPWSGPEERGEGHERQGLGEHSFPRNWVRISMAYAMGRRARGDGVCFSLAHVLGRQGLDLEHEGKAMNDRVL